MKITKQELIELNACSSGLDRFIEQTQNTDEPVKVTSLIGTGLVTTCDLVWLAGKKLSTEKLVRFACDCALLSIELIKPYADKYGIILGFLKNPTSEDAYYIASYVGKVACVSYAVRAEAYAAHAIHAAVYVSTRTTAYAAVRATIYDADYTAADYTADAVVTVVDYTILALALTQSNSTKGINELLVKLFS